MRNLLNFLARYNNLIIFLLLEGIGIYLVVSRNDYQNLRVMKNLRILTLGMENRIANTRSYLNLHNINTSIAQENVSLRNKMDRMMKSRKALFYSVSDSLHDQRYQYTSTEIVNNSVNRQKNYFTINKGKNQGVDIDMAVTSPDGVAGIIVASSENFAIGMSVLNLDFRLSARMKSNGYFGSLTWDGKDYRYAILNEVPQHVNLMEGDTVTTTGYSAIFPEGIMVGVVSDFAKTGGDFYKIRVLLSTDFKKINYVTVIGSLKRNEEKELEKSF